jgi:hypothetical protein
MDSYGLGYFCLGPLWRRDFEFALNRSRLVTLMHIIQTAASGSGCDVRSLLTAQNHLPLQTVVIAGSAYTR